ncbi:hypothetical protein V9K67_07010 [Paraflavisolibacter sp. H34]|uniref:hypothetical protein n=1 Tax=Huijunlia imazamoxiresistens TaxID=3127457 RepID=UPI0030166578
MTFYLINEEDHYKICFVKEKDSRRFHHECTGKILVHGSNILQMLCLFDLDMVARNAFSEN